MKELTSLDSSADLDLRYPSPSSLQNLHKRSPSLLITGFLLLEKNNK